MATFLPPSLGGLPSLGLGDVAGVGLDKLAGPALGTGSTLGVVPPGVIDGALVTEETTVGFLKKIPLPLLIPLLLLMVPAAIVASVVVAVVVAVVSTRVFFFIFPGLKPKKKEEYPYEEQPYPYETYPQAPQYPEGQKYRKKRTASSATPFLTMREVQNLTTVVLSSLRSQECLQRLLCEAGSLARAHPGTTKVVRAAEDYVPKPLQKSFNIFAKEKNCAKYACGDLPVTK